MTAVGLSRLLRTKSVPLRRALRISHQIRKLVHQKLRLPIRMASLPASASCLGGVGSEHIIDHLNTIVSIFLLRKCRHRVTPGSNRSRIDLRSAIKQLSAIACLPLSIFLSLYRPQAVALAAAAILALVFLLTATGLSLLLECFIGPVNYLLRIHVI